MCLADLHQFNPSKMQLYLTVHDARNMVLFNSDAQRGMHIDVRSIRKPPSERCGLNASSYCVFEKRNKFT